MRSVSGFNQLVPPGLAGRLTLAMMLLLIAVLWLSAGLYLHDRAETTVRLFSASVIERILVIVPLIESAPTDERRRLLRAVDSPTLNVGHTDILPPAGSAEWLHGRRFVERIKKGLSELGDRRIEILHQRRWHRAPRVPGGAASPPDLLHSHNKILVSVALRDGSWVHFLASTDTTSLWWATRMVLWIGAATVLFLVIAFWAAHRMTRPLRQFAETAERIGLDVRVPPLPETGPRELRNATRAFNQMQSRLRRLVDDRTMMLAAIGHDLRTLLTRLKLRAEFIDDEEQRQKAANDLDEMRRMLDSTLAFARDDATDGPRVPVDLAQLLRSLCEDTGTIGAPVRFEGPARLTCICSPDHVRRALRNIIGNGLEYGDDVRVTLKDDKDGIVIDIADSGPGIPPEQREDVFRPFYRLETSRNRETGGTGLGLAVARSILRRHGGDIVLLDRQGGGLVVRAGSSGR